MLFSDIVDSTGVAARLGDRGWHDLLDAHDAMVRRQLDRFGGREVKTTGDGFLATFDGPARAIGCSVALRDGAARLGLELTVGLHTGEIEMRQDGDVAGIGVHIAARVLAVATPGQILVSSAIPPLVSGSGIEFKDLGRHDLRGVPGDWNLLVVES